MSTYERATNEAGEHSGALDLYVWNAKASAALLVPLHICEVVLRNAISEAIEAVYGTRWPWSPGFQRSLPAPPVGYSPRRDLQVSRRLAPTTGKVIAELKFVFWQKMFTARHDEQLWQGYLKGVLPNLAALKPVAELRATIYDDLE